MLEKLEAGEAKYTCALNDAKVDFAGLQEQAKELDAAELYEARLAIREEKERDAEQRLKKAYGNNYDENIMYCATQNTKVHLDENEQKSRYLKLQNEQGDAATREHTEQAANKKNRGDVVL